MSFLILTEDNRLKKVFYSQSILYFYFLLFFKKLSFIFNGSIIDDNIM